MEMLTAFAGNIALGLSAALSLNNLFFCVIGVSVGMLVGVLPGIGPIAAMSLLFPLTFHLDPTGALIMLSGIWYGTAYGGSTSAILLNLPGGASSAVTSLDGYPMAQQGRAGIALFITTLGSFVGGSIGIVIMMMFSPLIARYAISFGSTEYFSLMLLGLVAASGMSGGDISKGLAMVSLGVLMGCVGSDPATGLQRMTFGSLDLADGIGLATLAMGVFGIAEVVYSVGKVVSNDPNTRRITFRSMVPTADDWRRSWAPILRGTGIGSFFGALPGTGPAIAAFVAYAVERRVSREPERFGKGAIEGVASPESANNAADQTAFIPTLMLGIPGSAPMAIMIGALMIQGIAPGPNFITNRPELFWGLVMSFWIGNLLLLILNIPLIGLWVRLLNVPFRWLYPSIVLFTCVGVFSVNSSTFDVWMVAALGFLGVIMRLTSLPPAPLLLGFVLGPMMEEHFRRTLIISRGDLSVFFTSPISGTIMALTATILAWSLFGVWRARGRMRLAIEEE
jgi:TctA family transporter